VGLDVKTAPAGGPDRGRTITRFCALCGTHQPVTEFRLDHRTRSGIAAYCRDCQDAAAEVAAVGAPPLIPAYRQAPGRPQPRSAVHVCLHPEPREGACGACTLCGLPIVALMRPGSRAKMDRKWRGWRTQRVTTLSGRVLDPAPVPA
jgi:hypothetical protein